MGNIENLRAIEKIVFAGGKMNSQQKETTRKKIDEYWDDHSDVGNRFPRWKKYIAWVAGHQLYDFNRFSRKLVEVPLKRKRRIVFNRLRSFVRTTLAKLSADVPQMSVIPKTSDNSDIEAARAGSRVIEHLADKVDLPAVLNSLKLWAIVTNRAYIRVFWDEDSEGVIDYEGNQKITEEGDVNMECVSPFNCRVDPLYFEHDKWRWFVFGEEVDAEVVEEEYKLKKGSLKETSQILGSAFDMEISDGQELVVGAHDKNEDITGRTIIFKEFWTPKIYIFTAGDRVLDYGAHNYGMIPFFPVEERLIPISNYEKGFQYNESLVKDAIAIQQEYNRMHSIVSIANERAAKMKVLVPFGSMISKKQFTNDYGVFIDYNPKMNARPHQMKLDPLPSSVDVYIQSLEREFEVAFGVREASFGRLPERASHASGTLVNLLLEQDDVLLNPMLATINKALSKAWGLALVMVQDNYAMPRLIRYVGENGQHSVAKFYAADLRGNTDVKVVSQTGLPRSRALRVEFIMKLREVGLLTDDKSTLEMLEFGQAEKMFQDSLLHERRAYRENDIIKENPEIRPENTEQWIHPLEEKEIHAVIHARFIFGAGFDKLNPNQQETANQHALKTVELFQEAQKAAQLQEFEMMERAKIAATKPVEEGAAEA